MKCPYCGGEMEMGYLNGSGARIDWFSAQTNRIAQKLVRLSLKTILTSSKLDGYRCQRCRKVILKY